jgi:vitamin B12 transporter
MRTPRISTALSLVLAGAPCLCAAQPIPFDRLPTDDGAREDEIVVSAARAPREAEEVGAAVSVIDAQDIAEGQYAFVADALRTAPGVSLARASSGGGVASVRLRGGASAQTLVVVDGVVVNDPAAPQGGFDFSSLDVAGVERIEILRGPQSVLYGSEAIGGVIAIETSHPRAPAARFRLEGGALETVRGAAEVGAGGAEGFARLSVSGWTSEGVSRAAGGVEKDGFIGGSAALRAGRSLGPRWSAELVGRANLAEAEIDGFPPPLFTLADTDEIQRSGEFFLAARAERVGKTRATFTLSYAGVQRRNLDAGAEIFSAKGGRLAAEAIADLPLAKQISLVAGVRGERSAADVLGVDDAATTGAVFALLEWAPVEALHLSAGARRDAFSDFDAATTARASGALKAGPLLWRASWGEGFRAPSLFERHYDGFGVVPNPDLRPEKARGFDAGAEWRPGRLSLRATYFQLAVRDQIDFDLARNGYVNIDRTRSRGVEAEADIAVHERAALALAYTFTDATDVSAGARLLRVPKHLLSATVTVAPAQGLRLSAAAIVNGREADVPAPNPGFVRLDLRAAHDLADCTEIFARFENALDADYQDVSGYGEPGASFYAGVSVRL